MSETQEIKATVHVVDDDSSFQTAISRLLRAAGYEVCNYGSAGEFALMQPPAMHGCVLLDVRMPGPSGLELQQALRKKKESLPIIFLTAHGDVPMSVRAMKAGAVDFLTKPVKRTELLAAVRKAVAQNCRFRAVLERRQDAEDRLAQLTPREREVFLLVTVGKLNKQIAAEIGAAERTVKAHRARVMSKMQAKSLAELVQIAGWLREGKSEVSEEE